MKSANVNGKEVVFEFEVGDVVCLKSGDRHGVVASQNLQFRGGVWIPCYEVLHEDSSRFMSELMLKRAGNE